MKNILKEETNSRGLKMSEFNLKEKREELFKKFDVWTMNLDWLSEQINEQDEKFVRLLKEDLNQILMYGSSDVKGNGVLWVKYKKLKQF